MQLVDEGADTNKLWMGDVRIFSVYYRCKLSQPITCMQLEPFMDEQFLTSAFTQFGYHVQSIRWIRNYQTGCVQQCCSNTV